MKVKSQQTAYGMTEARMSYRQSVGYGAGDAGYNLVFSLVGSFLLLYYTDVVGLPATTAGTIFFLVRIWDAISDLLVGQLVDRTRSRFGKFRPWLLFASAPLLISSVLVFSVPSWLNSGWTIVYVVVTYLLLTTMYSFVTIPYGSLASAMTQKPEERGKLAMARNMGASASGIMLAIVVAPQIERSADLQASLTVTTMVFVPIGFALFLFTFLTSRENVPRDFAVVPLRESMRTLLHNTALMRLCAASVIFLVGMFSLSAMGVYYARDIMGNANYFVILSVIQYGGMFCISALAPKVIATIGKRAGYIAAAVAGAIGGVGVFFAPTEATLIAFASWTLMTLGLGFVNALMWALEADTVEYGEWRTGQRTEGATYAVFSFVRKIGQALGGSMGAMIIGIGGYEAGMTVQGTSAEIAIRTATGLVPAVLFLLSGLIMFFYPLTESRLRAMVRDIGRRRHNPKEE